MLYSRMLGRKFHKRLIKSMFGMWMSWVDFSLKKNNPPVYVFETQIKVMLDFVFRII